MTEFNPINMNPDRGLRINFNSNNESNNEQPANSEQEEDNFNQLQNFIPADQVLDFMNKSAIQSFQSNKIDTSKYVNSEQKTRITQSVVDYLKLMSDMEKSSMQEFNTSPELAQSIALQAFNTQYMPS